MDNGIYVVEVRVHGRKVRELQHEGETWIEGRKGSDFTIRIRNTSYNRILAVPSIDGLSVMDGEEASFDSSGYVISGQSHLDIPGWRLNNDEVAKFRFGKSAKSYAAKKGKALNVGVIGVAVFEEKAGYTFTVSNMSAGTERGGGFDFNGSGILRGKGFDDTVYGSSTGGQSRGSETTFTCSTAPEACSDGEWSTSGTIEAASEPSLTSRAQRSRSVTLIELSCSVVASRRRSPL
jgi:hypothetical protein